MKLNQLFEESGKTAAVAFGRLNPPTIGHEKLVEAVLKQKADDHFLFVSHTHKPTGKNRTRFENPLPFDVKINFIQQAFSNISIGNTSIKTVIEMMKYLETQGYKRVIFVCGSDRVGEFTQLLNAQNGIDYNIESLEIKSSGQRDPDGEGVEGMSGTKMRQAVIDGDFDKFKSNLPSALQANAEEVYNAVKSGLAPWISEQYNEANIDANELVDVYIKGSHKGRSITKLVTKKFPNNRIPSLIKKLSDKFGINPNAVVYGPSKNLETYPENFEEGWKSKLAGAALAGATALGGAAAQAGDLEKSIGPLPVMATIVIKMPDGSNKTIKKDLGHAYDYKLDDAKKDIENLLDKKGIKQYTIHLDRYDSNDIYLDRNSSKDKASDYSAKSDYIDKGPYTAKGNKTDYMDKSPYKAQPSTVNYLDKAKSSKEFRDMENY